MAVVTQTPVEKCGCEENVLTTSTFIRVSRYVVMRLLTLFATVVIGIYLTIMIANMGGYVDQIMKGEIRDRVTQIDCRQSCIRQMDPPSGKKLIDDTIASGGESASDLNIPIAIRNFRYLSNALTLQLGRAINMTSDSGSKQVRLILLERLPATLLLMGISQLFLVLFQHLPGAESFPPLWQLLGQAGDRAFAHLCCASLVLWHFSDPDLCCLLKVLPFGGMVDSPPPSNPLIIP